MRGEVERSRSVVIGDAIDIDCRSTPGYAVVGVPSVIRVVPRTAAYVDVSRTGVTLLIGKAVGVATIVLIVEIVVRVAVDHHVVASATQLYACIATTINIEVLQNVVLAFLHPNAFVSGIADGEVLEMQVVATHLDAIRLVGLLAEVDDGLAVTVTLNGNELVGGTLAVDAERVLQVVLSAQQIKVVSPACSLPMTVLLSSPGDSRVYLLPEPVGDT